MILKVMSLIQTQSSIHTDVKERDQLSEQKPDVLFTKVEIDWDPSLVMT